MATTTTTTNRVTRAVDTMQDTIDTLDDEAKARCDQAATLDRGTWLALGNLASRALLAGELSADEAQTAYGIWRRFHDDASLAERMVYTQLAMELVKRIGLAG